MPVPMALTLLLGLLLLGGCTVHLVPPGPAVVPATLTDGAFVLPDGARLPYRSWLPEGMPRAVVLALHGFDDSRDAWELPAPDFAEAGLAVISPDQRGFGAAPGRGFWPGTDGLVGDAAEMVVLVRRRYPGLPLILMAESMGAAVAINLAARPDLPQPDRYVLLAPAVWGRSKMNPFLRGALWVAYRLAPGLTLTGRFAHVLASDNRAALIRLSTDPLTIRETRVDAIQGLVDLMDAALAAAPALPAGTLILYGGKDALVPPEAMAATWRAVPAGVRTGFYPQGYHLLMRDHGRAEPIGDVLNWIADPAAPLPSGAEARAKAWLAEQGPTR